jgi:predicted nucleic acid-binding protein
MTPAYIDANVPMYAGGTEHPYRDRALQVLALVGERPSAFVCSAEVLQEILHRYLSQQIWTRGRAVFAAFDELMSGRVGPVLAGDVALAAELADMHRGPQARDLLHLAVMRRLGVTRIVSTDRGFDRIDGVTRLDPANFETWESSLD